jgi:hypothetical protein
MSEQNNNDRTKKTVKSTDKLEQHSEITVNLTEEEFSNEIEIGKQNLHKELTAFILVTRKSGVVHPTRGIGNEHKLQIVGSNDELFSMLVNALVRNDNFYDLVGEAITAATFKKMEGK